MATSVRETVLSHNLAYGVILGVIVAMVFFARRVEGAPSVDEQMHQIGEVAEERCKRLRDRLEAGQELSRTLRTEVAAATAGKARPRR